jgi:hypothetical protein
MAADRDGLTVDNLSGGHGAGYLLGGLFAALVGLWLLHLYWGDDNRHKPFLFKLLPGG